MTNHWMRPLGRAAGSLVLVIGSVLLPVGAASASPMPQATPVTIRDGTYEIFYTTGVDWDPQNRTFTRDRNFKRFDDTLKFATTKTATEIRWSTWTVTLHSVIGGNANASEVSQNDFPAL